MFVPDPNQTVLRVYLRVTVVPIPMAISELVGMEARLPLPNSIVLVVQLSIQNRPTSLPFLVAIAGWKGYCLDFGLTGLEQAIEH